MKVEELTEIITEMFESRIEWLNDMWKEGAISKEKDEFQKAFNLFKQCELIEKQDDEITYKPNFTRKKRGWE